MAFDWNYDEAVVRAAVGNGPANERFNDIERNAGGEPKRIWLYMRSARDVKAFEAANRPVREAGPDCTCDAGCHFNCHDAGCRCPHHQTGANSAAVREAAGEGFDEWWNVECEKLVATLEGEDHMDTCGESIARAAWTACAERSKKL